MHLSCQGLHNRDYGISGQPLMTGNSSKTEGRRERYLLGNIVPLRPQIQLLRTLPILRPQRYGEEDEGHSSGIEAGAMGHAQIYRRNLAVEQLTRLTSEQPADCFSSPDFAG
jgi:hypothetical protein